MLCKHQLGTTHVVYVLSTINARTPFKFCFLCDMTYAEVYKNIYAELKPSG